MNDVIRSTVKTHNKQPGKLEWRVLIVDDQSMRMVSACTKMHELSAEGITSKILLRNVVHLQPRQLMPSFPFSCRDHWEEEGAVAGDGSHLLDHAFRKKCEGAHVRFPVAKPHSIPGCSRLLHWRWDLPFSNLLFDEKRVLVSVQNRIRKKPKSM